MQSDIINGLQRYQGPDMNVYGNVTIVTHQNYGRNPMMDMMNSMNNGMAASLEYSNKMMQSMLNFQLEMQKMKLYERTLAVEEAKVKAGLIDGPIQNPKFLENAKLSNSPNIKTIDAEVADVIEVKDVTPDKPEITPAHIHIKEVNVEKEYTISLSDLISRLFKEINSRFYVYRAYVLNTEIYELKNKTEENRRFIRTGNDDILLLVRKGNVDEWKSCVNEAYNLYMHQTIKKANLIHENMTIICVMWTTPISYDIVCCIPVNPNVWNNIDVPSEMENYRIGKHFWTWVNDNPDFINNENLKSVTVVAEPFPGDAIVENLNNVIIVEQAALSLNTHKMLKMDSEIYTKTHACIKSVEN